jgi:hypothetical protein
MAQRPQKVGETSFRHTKASKSNAMFTLANLQATIVHLMDYVFDRAQSDSAGQCTPFPDNWYFFLFWNGNELAGPNGYVPDRLSTADEFYLTTAFKNLGRLAKLLPHILCQIGGTSDIWKLSSSYDAHIADLASRLRQWGMPAWTGQQTLEALAPYKRKMRTGHGDA